METIQRNRTLIIALTLGCVGAFFASVEGWFLSWLLLRAWVLLITIAPGVAVVAACAGYGAWFLPGRGDFLSAWAERVTLAFAAGIGVLSSLVFLAGMTGNLSPAVGLTVVAGGLLSGWMWMRSEARSGRLSRQATEIVCETPDDLVSRIAPGVVWTLAGVTAMLVGLISLTPPLIFDVTEYHLGAWTDYWDGQCGAFIPMPHNFYARFPFPVEAIYFLGLAISPEADAAPKIFNGAGVLACGALAWCFARRLGGGRLPAAVAALLAVAHPVMLEVSIDAMIDAPMALLVAGSFYSALAFRERGICLTLFLFGSALATKYTVAQVFLLPWTLMVFAPMAWGLYRIKRVGWFMAALAAASVPCLLWFGKNWAWYGNPLEPFFQSIFRADAPGLAAREKFYVESHFPQSIVSSQYWGTLFPRFREFGWVVLVACGGWLFAADRRAAARLAVVIVLSVLLWNTVRDSQNRFLLPLFVMTSAFAAVGVQMVPLPMARQVIFATLVLFALSGATRFGLRVHESKAVDYLLNFAPTSRTANFSEFDEPSAREDYLEHNLGDLGRVVNHINRSLPEGARVLMIYEARPYLLRPQTVYNVVWDDSVLLNMIRPAQSVDEALTLIREAGISHVLINRQELLRYIQQYARKGQLLRLGVNAAEDPRAAWYATPTPEDLYPPFYRDKDWDRLRPLVHELLDRLDGQAKVREGVPATGSGVEPIDVTLVEL